MEDVHPLTAYRLAQDPPLTEADLARKLGVGRSAVFRWERGDRKIDETKLPHIAEVTGIAPKDLRPDLVEKLKQLMGAS